MKPFLKQIFKSNSWEHISQENLEMVNDGSISDFWILVINFIGPFLIGWGVGALAKTEPNSTFTMPSLMFGTITGLIFVFFAFIKCYYEFNKQRKKQVIADKNAESVSLNV